MRRNIIFVAAITLLLVWLLWPRSSPPAASLAQNQPATDLEARLRALTPQRVTQIVREISKEEGTSPLEIQINFEHADLDGSGQFNFVVASYTTMLGGTLRIFRETNSQLEVVADLPPDIEVGGSRFRLELVDVDNDGKPEIKTLGHGARTHYSFRVFEWTGDSLRLVTAHADTGDGDLEDVDGDGILEIVTPPDCTGVKPTQPLADCVGPYTVYKFNGTEFQLAFTSPVDPAGVISPTGENQEVFADRALMSPETFPLAAIHRALQKAQGEGGVVTVRLGNLGGAEQGARFDVKDIDPTILRLGRTIRSLRTEILPASAQEKGQGEAGGFRGDFLQAEFDRGEVLRFLPRTQLNKALEAGDKLTLELRGKMKNGAPLDTSVTVQITGP